MLTSEELIPEFTALEDFQAVSLDGCYPEVFREHVESDTPGDGKIVGGVVGAQAGAVFVEGPVELPVWLFSKRQCKRAALRMAPRSGHR